MNTSSSSLPEQVERRKLIEYEYYAQQKIGRDFLVLSKYSTR